MKGGKADEQGTLIYNTLTDIYPYLRLIGTITWEDFRKQIHCIASRKPRLAARRAQALLRKVMLRRTKDSELGGKKILQLPPKTTELIEMDFTLEERAIYAALERAARVQVNKWFKAGRLCLLGCYLAEMLMLGTILKHYHVVLVLLTRLRQMCCHPWLLRASKEYMDQHQVVPLDETSTGPTSTSDLPLETQKEKALELFGQKWVDQIIRKLEERYETRIKAEGDSKDDDYVSVHHCDSSALH